MNELLSVQINTLIHKIDGNIEERIDRACNKLFDSIRDRTPKRTGRAKFSWKIGDHFSDEIEPEGDYLSAIKNYTGSNYRFEFSKSSGTVYIYNNLDYINYLEAGSSKQAPSGMVAVSLAEFRAYF